MIWNKENDRDRTSEQIKQEWEQGPDQRTKNKATLLLFLFMIVAIPLFYWWHVFFYKKLATSIAPEYKAWEKKYNERRDYLTKQSIKAEEEATERVRQQKNLTDSEKTQRIKEIRDKDLGFFIGSFPNDLTLQNIKTKEPKKYQYPPSWRVFLYSVPATLFSAYVLYAMVHGIRWVFLWIVRRFKGKKKKVETEMRKLEAEMQKELQEHKRKALLFKNFKE